MAMTTHLVVVMAVLAVQELVAEETVECQVAEAEAEVTIQAYLAEALLGMAHAAKSGCGFTDERID